MRRTEALSPSIQPSEAQYVVESCCLTRSLGFFLKKTHIQKYIYQRTTAVTWPGVRKLENQTHECNSDEAAEMFYESSQHQRLAPLICSSVKTGIRWQSPLCYFDIIDVGFFSLLGHRKAKFPCANHFALPHCLAFSNCTFPWHKVTGVQKKKMSGTGPKSGPSRGKTETIPPWPQNHACSCLFYLWNACAFSLTRRVQTLRSCLISCSSLQ